MNVTPEMINALSLLRSLVIEHGGELKDAVDTLDNAGVFAEIDEASDYDVSAKGYARQEQGYMTPRERY